MKTNLKRVLSLVCALALCIGMLPMSALAADGLDAANSQIEYEGGTVYYDNEGNSVTGGVLGEDGVVVEMSKTVEPTGTENEFEVTLEVKTNQKVTEISTESPDAAVVLVLDVSNSMDNCVNCGAEEDDEVHGKYGYKCPYRDTTFERDRDSHGDNPKCRNCNRRQSEHTERVLIEEGTCEYSSRLAAAQEAAKQFLNDFAALEGDGARYVSVVSFGSNAQTALDWIDVSETGRLEEAKNAVDDVQIGNGGGFDSSDGGTNIEAGLMLARNLLNEQSEDGVDYLYAVLLTDGSPTYHVDGDEDSTDFIRGKQGGGSYATPDDVKDVAGIADDIQDFSSMARVYSICFGEGVYDSKLCQYYDWRDWIGTDASSDTTIGEWLDSFSDEALDGGSDLGSLLESFDDVINQIILAAQAWTVTDVMGSAVNYEDEVKEDHHNNVTFDEDEDTLTWDIKKSRPSDETYAPWEGVTLTYTLTYRVTLDNLANRFSNPADVNQSATLQYITTDRDGDWDYDLKEGTFDVPQVNSLYGDLTFTKVDEDTDPLKDVTFTLTTADNDDWSMTATSDENGTVTFSKIPSGHEYTLTETGTPEGYVTAEPITVTVANGVVTTTKADGTPLTLNNGTLVNNPVVVAKPEISVDKELTSVERGGETYTREADNLPEYLLAGDKLTWTITVTNSGDADATGLKLTDELKIGGIEVDAGITVSGKNGTNPDNFDVPKSGGSAEFEATYTVKGEDAGRQLTNAAKVGDKEITTDPIPVNYEFVVTYDGNGGTADGAETKKVSVTSTTESASYTVEDDDFGFTRDGYTFAGWFDAETSGDNKSGQGITVTDNNTVLYAHWEEIPPSLEVTKSTDKGDTTVKLGDEITYTVTIEAAEGNTGILKNFKVEDDKLPDSVEDITIQRGGAAVTGATLNGNTLTFTLEPPLGENESITVTYKYPVSQDDVTNGKVENSAQVTAWNENPDKPGDGTGETTTEITGEITDITKALVMDTATVPEAVKGAIPQGISLTVKPLDNDNVLWLEKGTTSVTLLYAITVTGDPGAFYHVYDGGATFVASNATGTIPATGSVTLYAYRTFYLNDAAKTTAGQQLINTAAIQGNDDLKDDEKTTVKVENPAVKIDKELVKVNGETYQDNAKVSVDDMLTYEVKVTNTGNVKLDEVIISDSLWGEKTGVTSVKVGDVEQKLDTVNGFVCSISALEVGESVTITYTYQVQEEYAGKTLSNTAVVSGDDIEDDGGDTETVPVYNPELEVKKTAAHNGKILTSGDQVEVNDTITYTINIKNTGDQTLTGVVINDNMWTADTVITCECDVIGEFDSEQLKYYISKLEPGETLFLTYTYTVTEADANLGEIKNTVVVTSNEDVPGTDEVIVDVVPVVTITPADITVYTGGAGYSGVTNDQGQIVGDTTSGLPEPGYHIDLPDAVNEWLASHEFGTGDADSAALNLADIMNFTYNYGGQTRTWDMNYVGIYATDAESGLPTRYVYSLQPGKTESGTDIPVRLLFTDSNGDEITSDAVLEMDENTVSATYSMTINPGGLTRGEIKAVFSVKDPTTNETDSITCNIKIGTGTLTVRSVVDRTDNTTTIANERDDVTEDVITAVDNSVVTYYVDGSGVTISNADDGNTNRVQLLVDAVSDNPGYNASMGADAISEVRADGISLSNPTYESAYLDLVDTQNGNTVITMAEGDKMVIYWPMPSNADENGEFRIVHYIDMNRHDNTDSIVGEDDLANEKNEVLIGTRESLNGRDYIRFEASSFSPFVLVYEAEDTTEPDPDPDTPSRPSHRPDRDDEPEDLNTEDHVGYLIGFTDGTIRPEDDISRAEVATIFFRLLTDEARETYWSQTNSYSDVAPDAWYNNAVSTLSNMGILDGYLDGTFRPNAPITRSEFTKIAVSFFDYAAEEYKVETL